ncbi:MAG: NAD(P)H-hydrate dehydratase [bacterium]
MKLVTTSHMRELDRRMIEEFETKGETLMARAGESVAHVVHRIADFAGFVNPCIHLIAGRGNNGGDAFVAAKQLKDMGLFVEVWIAGSLNQVTGDAMLHLSRMKAAKVPLREMPTIEDWQDAIAHPFLAEIIVDGVLGTGITGPARGPAAGAIQYIKSQADDALCVAIDVPSGLNADTGLAEGEAVLADVTVTMGLPKIGLVDPTAVEHVGSIEVADIGLPPELVDEVSGDPDRELIHTNDLKHFFPRRRRASHKGSYGHVLLIGGARGYAGSIALSARAALRSGVGLVSVLAPEGIRNIVAGAALEAMVWGGAETESGSLAARAWTDVLPRIGEFKAVLVGPGLTRHAESLALVKAILAGCPVPLVLDADAISVLEDQAGAIAKAKSPVIITPHPGELGRLLGLDAKKVQADRCGHALLAVKKSKGVVVLKGAGTVVACEGKPAQINMTGNPGMATGGAGDVLAGLMAGLLAQGMTPFDAARTAVYVHGKAGDNAAWRKSQVSMNAGDIIDELSYAFREFALR